MLKVWIALIGGLAHDVVGVKQKEGHNNGRADGMGVAFFGMAAVFAGKVPLDGGCHYFEVKGMDLEVLGKTSNAEPQTVYNLTISFCHETRSFDVIQSFPAGKWTVGFTIDRLGDVTSFKDRLPPLDAEGWVAIDGRKAYDVEGCEPGEELSYAREYVERVADVFQRCGMREARGGGSWRG